MADPTLADLLADAERYGDHARRMTANERDAFMAALHAAAESASADKRDDLSLALFVAFDLVADVADEMGDPE